MPKQVRHDANDIISLSKQYDSMLRKYKIASIAEEGGFSSYKTFVSCFTNLIQMSPSRFIAYLEKEENTGLSPDVQDQSNV